MRRCGRRCGRSLTDWIRGRCGHVTAKPPRDPNPDGYCVRCYRLRISSGCPQCPKNLVLERALSSRQAGILQTSLAEAMRREQALQKRLERSEGNPPTVLCERTETRAEDRAEAEALSAGVDAEAVCPTRFNPRVGTGNGEGSKRTQFKPGNPGSRGRWRPIKYVRPPLCARCNRVGVPCCGECRRARWLLYVVQNSGVNDLDPAAVKEVARKHDLLCERCFSQGMPICQDCRKARERRFPRPKHLCPRCQCLGATPNCPDCLAKQSAQAASPDTHV
jgi:hypothetical protein